MNGAAAGAQQAVLQNSLARTDVANSRDTTFAKQSAQSTLLENMNGSESLTPDLIDGRLVDEERSFHHVIGDVLPPVSGNADPGVFVDAPPFPPNLVEDDKKCQHRQGDKVAVGMR